MKWLYFNVVVLLLLNFSVQAQKLAELKNYDTMVHVYKLNYEQTKYVLKDGFVRDTSFLFTKKFREYPSSVFKNDTLPEGHFVVATIIDQKISYNYFYRTPFYITPKVIDEDVILYLNTKKDKRLIKEAKLEIDGKPIKYDAGYGGFSFPKKSILKENLLNNKVLLKVSFEGEIYVFKYSFQDGAKPAEEPNYYNNPYAELNSPGYLILDKPMYKPLDSLNLKSFLINFKNGNPIRKRVKLEIIEPIQNFKFQKILRKKSAGAYVYQWKIPDTLKLDRDYEIKLSYTKKGRRLARKTSFKLEEYELNKNKYDVEMPNEAFYAGDDIMFYVTAKDMNGFPVQGTRVNYKLRINQIQDLFVDTFTLTPAKKNNWYEKDTTVEYENFMELAIPSNILLKANARYSLEVTFVDPMTFEKKAFVKNFIKYTQKEKLLFYQQTDSIIVRNLFNSKDTAKPYYFMTFRGADTLTKKKITTPFRYKLRPSETNAIVMDADSFKTSINIAYNKLEMMHAKGKRTGDSILISFAYPFDEPIHYRIYKKDKLVKSGESNTLKFAMLDQSADHYRIVMTTNLHNQIENNFYEMKFVPEQQLLHFEKKIAGTALPGDSMAIELRALDYKNRPVRKVNIAAYSVNAAFENSLQIPYVEVPKQYQNRIEINPIASRDVAYLKSDVNSGTYHLSNAHLARFNLRKNEYYAFKYPLNEMTEIAVKKQQAHPEFAVVLTVKDVFYTPRYILLDGQPIYISDINAADVYSFAATAGKHNITFRYFDKTYELKNIEFKAYTKHLFGINVDSVYRINSRFDIVDSLTMLEPTADEKKLLYSTMVLTNQFYVDSFEVNTKNLNRKTKRVGYVNLPRINIDGETYFVQGPFAANSSVEMKLNAKPFNLKTGIETVYHYDELLKEFIPKPLGGIKGAFLHFSETPLQLYALNSLIVPDTVVPKPTETPMVYKPETAKALQQKEEEYFYQNYAASVQDGITRIMIENRNDTNYIKSIWIINKSNFQACDFIQSVSKGNAQIIRRAINEPFDVYLFYNKNRMVVLKNLKQENQNDFYINAQLLQTEPFDKDKIEVPLKIYAELNAVPLVPFYDAPYIIKDKIKRIPNPRNNLYLHGMITDESQMPLEGALVYVEINGKFKYGAVTNANGLFELLDLLPATYQLKIYHPNYAISHVEPMLFDAQTEYVFNTSLKEKGMNHPLFEVIQSDFRMMAFIQNNQENKLKVSIHDKESRSVLNDVQLKLIYLNETIKTFTLNQTTNEIPFYLSNTAKIFSIELSKPGYTSIRLNGIEFVKNYTYVLEAFLGLEKKEILKQKEYNINMQGRLPEFTSTEYDYSIIEETENDENESGSDISEIYGRVVDELNQPLDFATVLALKGSAMKGGTKTDINGNFKIKPLLAGTYVIRVTYAGFITEDRTEVKVGRDKRVRIDFKLEKKLATTKSEVKIIAHKNSLIDPSDPGKKTMYASQIKQAPSVSTRDIATNEEGVYQRSSSPNYMIDGMTVSGSSSASYTSPATSNFEILANGITANYGNFKIVNSNKATYADASMIDQVSSNENTSTIRKKFSDVGYWQPNLITNKNGLVAFTVKLPDNITSWKSYFVGVGRKWLHGVDQAETKVYKPLQTIAIVPSYFYTNDKIEAKIKYQNLTKDPLLIQSKINVNGMEKVNKDVTIKHTYMDSLMLDATEHDSIRFEGGMVYKEKYKDFEQYDIPVFSSAMKFASNQSIRMEKDSTYILRIEPNTKGTIRFNNSLYEKVVAVVDNLNQYEYDCVEQTTSKLSSLLVKYIIQNKLQIKSSVGKDITKLLARLSDMQNTDGSFGWWRNNGVDDRMTIYCMEVTLEAMRYGFQNNVFNACRDYILQHYKSMSKSDQIYALNVFLRTSYSSSEMMAEYAKMNTEFLNTTDKLYFTQNKIALKQEVKKEDIYALFLEMNAKVNRPYYDNFFYDYKSDVFKAYTLFKSTPYAVEFIEQFKKKLLNGQYEQNLNTYAKAKMIEALLQDVMTDTAKPIQSTLVINDTLRIKTFPYQLNIAHSTYSIKHVGGNVFLNTSEEHVVETPSKHDSVFAVRTSFKQNNTEVTALKSGVACQYNVIIQAYKTGEHVMVEIPLPAGMKVKYKEKNFAKGDYVEYYKHKVVYYFEKLPMGMKSLQIELMPVFKGQFVVPATKASLMYYPFVYGNSLNSTLSIQ
jgi:protocatechuate 3,4-dioxygenase beta subunit